MRFGLFFLMQRDPAWTEQDVYAATLAEMDAAEALGFSSVWIAEHHFSDYGLCPTPPVLAAYAAARSRVLRVGLAVSLLALHDPVALAEAFAVIDQVSGGRLDVGIGRGGMVEDYRAFGIPYEESWARIEEGIALLRCCWSGEIQHYQGRFRSLVGVRVTPRPVQRPHPPLFIAANSLETTLATARLGLPTLTSFYTPDEEIRRLRAAYRQESVRSGREPEAVKRALAESWGMCCVHIAHDTATAIAAAAEPFLRYRARLSDRPNTGRRLTHAGPRSLQEHLDTNTAMFGSPDEVAERLARYADQTGLTRLMLLMAIPGLPVADVMRSMELCAARVLPQLAADSVDSAGPAPSAPA